jgi:glycosidase
VSKIVIYQLFPRYFGNRCQNRVKNGDITQNGCGKFEDISDRALESIKELGVTHIWLTGIIEHATQTDYTNAGIERDHPAIVKGKAGSPYAIKDYFDVDPDLATQPEHRIVEFKRLIERCHQKGLKVLIDFVPNHIARNYKSDIVASGARDFGIDDYTDDAFNPSNNFYYLPDQAFEPKIDLYAGASEPYREFPAKVTGNDCFSASPGTNDWYETVKLNYGVDYQAGGLKYFVPVPSTWFKMLDVLEYWVSAGVDGFRCDMAEMVPVEFWNWVIPRVKNGNPSELFIAEVYKPDMYREYINEGGFDYLYDKVGMYDTLRSIIQGHRPASDISSCWKSVNDIFPHMLYFLENHDEQRIASRFFANDPLRGIPGFIIAACLYRNPVMIYSGQELGEPGMYSEGFSSKDGRSTIYDYWGLETLSAWNNDGKWNLSALTLEQINIRHLYERILNIAISEESISDGEFFDLTYVNTNNDSFDSSKQFAFLRKSEIYFTIIAVNFSSQPVDIKLNIPKHAFECFGITEHKERIATELLTGNVMKLVLSSEYPLEINIPANSGVILRCIM